jgi:hypothetical protein
MHIVVVGPIDSTQIENAPTHGGFGWIEETTYPREIRFKQLARITTPRF